MLRTADCAREVLLPKYEHAFSGLADMLFFDDAHRTPVVRLNVWKWLVCSGAAKGCRREEDSGYIFEHTLKAAGKP
jgi:hypothetical protein